MKEMRYMKEINFESLGIPADQIQKLENHLKKAENYVFPQDPGLEESLEWLKYNLVSNLDMAGSELLYQIAVKNLPDFNVEYTENGYDSCQSHRKLSKVLGEAILLGGLVYEYGLLGIDLSVMQAMQIVGSTLTLSKSQIYALPRIAQMYGSSQDFLFPGVTPSSLLTPSLSQYAYNALSGKPLTTVRSLTGVGGIRFDKDWNYAVDFSTFVNLKIEEDKRYYPGIGIYFALLNLKEGDIPALDNRAMKSLAQAIKSVQEKKYQGVSVLCSAYIPPWRELKEYQHTTGNNLLEISESFHSPAYDFAGLFGVTERLKKSGSLDAGNIAQVNKLKAKLGNIWSFNSTIHLPWTSELAGISNDLMGVISNKQGDWAIRYGVGWHDTSLEIREYHFGQERKFPFDLSGKVAYGLLFYPKSGFFSGEVENIDLTSANLFWNEVNRDGFMAAALKKLENIKIE